MNETSKDNVYWKNMNCLIQVWVFILTYLFAYYRNWDSVDA